MSSALRQRLRFLLRRRVHVLDDEIAYIGRDRELLSIYQQAIEGTFDARDREFVQQRYRESVRLRRAIEALTGSPLNGKLVLDVGAGSGAFGLAVASRGSRAVGVDPIFNDAARQLRRAVPKSLESIAADARQLPFRSGSFDVVTAFETIEHLRDLGQCGSEIIRVLRKGGYLCVTTPARLRYLVGRDPHFGVRGLLALPDPWQRRIVARRGYAGEVHHVEHTFWTAWGIARVFPSTRTVAVIGRSFVPWLSWDLIVLQKK